MHEGYSLDIDTIISNLNVDEELASNVAIEWMKSCGFKFETRDFFHSYMWDGQTFNDNLPDRHILHDLAHWIVATPERRSVPEFGLGPGPESIHDEGFDEKAILIDEKNARIEERRAALLGILIQNAIGLPVGMIAEEVGLIDQVGQYPPKSSMSIWQKDLDWLYENKFIDIKGYPSFVRDHPLNIPVTDMDMVGA